MPKAITAKEFQDVAGTFQQLWLQVIKESELAGEATTDERNDTFQLALQQLMSLVGPR